MGIVRDKLSVPEVGSVNLSDKKLEQLKAQIATELLPTLRMREVELVDFNLKKVFDLLSHFVETSLSERI